MKFKLIKSGILFFCFAIINIWQCTNAVMIRVCIAEFESAQKKILNFKTSSAKKFSHDSDGNFKIHLGPKNKFLLNDKELNISCDGESIFYNGIKAPNNKIVIESISKYFFYENFVYEGFMALKLHKGKLYVINYLDLENYVSSVLHAESWPGWPLEVNEVFAIMCRTYATYTINMSRKKTDSAFDIKNTNLHQTFKGVTEHDVLHQATNNTKHLILTFNQNPILAMYDTCCGSVVPAHIKGHIDFQKAPYLSRPYACKFCKKSKVYSWKHEYEQKYLEELFREKLGLKGTLQDIKITKKDKAGLVQELLVKTKHNSVKITGKKIYSLLKNVKSLCFSTHKKGKKIFFNGAGYGHQIGLCQWGARQMIKENWKRDQVLSFFFPSTKLMKIKA